MGSGAPGVTVSTCGVPDPMMFGVNTTSPKLNWLNVAAETSASIVKVTVWPGLMVNTAGVTIAVTPLVVEKLEL